jgi:hypothetical protein
MDDRSSAEPSFVRPPLTVRVRTAGLLTAAALGAAVLMTWPLASGMGHLGRTQNSGDGRFAVWNVAWVAHALTANPTGLFDANIFYPHRKALAFSEANIGAGTLAVPVWAATHNPFAAHNSVVLFAFSASVVFTWLLVRRLTGDGGAAATSAILFAFCPYVLAHTAHIQLLMVAGIPLSMLAFHCLVDAPSPARGVALGLALAAQAMSCAYYGVSTGLTVGFATLFYAWSRRLWTSRPFWIAIAIAAASSVGIVLPFLLPFLGIQEDTGFARSLDDARKWSAYARSYLASGAHAHAWMLPLIRDWNAAVLFPGFVSLGLGLAGAAIALRDRVSAPDAARLPRDRETAFLYGSIAILTFWASLGPRGGLYAVLYTTIPIFSFLRAPERMGIVVMLCLAIFAAFAVRELRRRRPASRRAIAVVASAAALLELNDLPLDWRPDSIPSTYRVLAGMPRGPVAEFPFYDRRIDFHIHTRYMLNSTAHWQPLLNGYSDHIPADFRALAPILGTFPSRESFDALKDRRVRYITLNRGRQGYGGGAWPDIERRMQPYLPHLQVVADDGALVIYEVVSWPK